VLLDNGRTAVLSDADGRDALNCIRCSACLNVCPVYERAGGHAYGSIYPGPIGAILSPQLTGIEDNASLPYASSLCGACYDVCPVKINIPEILVHLRAEHTETYAAEHRLPSAESSVMKAAAFVMSNPARWTLALRSGRLGRILGRKRGSIGEIPLPLLKQWTEARDLTRPPKRTFRDQWAQSLRDEERGERKRSRSVGSVEPSPPSSGRFDGRTSSEETPAGSGP
jgi:L-lactate dehydrogenase complex protein LldF